ncbi:MAG: hypothetical protein HZB95_01855 [Nitrosomonadales bacterium]|nr:hypothetical protein [Nitrosomonadales bacterium]
MKRIILALVLATFSSISNAGFDYTCLQDCSEEGSTFQYCTTKCTINDFPIVQQSAPSETGTEAEARAPSPTVITPHTDASCLAECDSAGYSKEFCQQRCTF